MHRVIQALFLVLGTAMGGGILALPLAVSAEGWIPAALTLFSCFLFMAVTADFVLQANLWCPEGTHLIGTARYLLGAWGARAVWVLFCFVGYASLVAYLSGVGEILVALTPGGWAPMPLVLLLLTALFGLVLAKGAHYLARWNSWFVVLMLLFLFGVMLTSMSEARLNPFADWQGAGVLKALPLFLTSFSFQMIVPSLRHLLRGDARGVRIACWGGLSVTLLIYLLWLAVVFALVPKEGPHGLLEASQLGEPITTTLLYWTQSPWLMVLITSFSLFALITSFLGIGLGLYEFLLDGLHRFHVHWGVVKRRAILLFWTLLPTLLGALWFERAFLEALDITGGLGDSTLNGLIPVAMIAQGWQRSLTPQVLHRPLLRMIGATAFAFLVIGVECVRLFGWS